MNMDLYHRWDCVDSTKVRDFILHHHLEHMINYIDIEEDAKFRFDLKALTGKTQVPCLVIGDTPLLESDLIIEWLKENLIHTSEVSHSE
jgi:glutathione S-transferase